MSSPLGLTQATAGRTDAPSDIRTGKVVAVTTRGVDVQVADGLIKSAGHLTSYNPAVGDTVTMIAFADTWAVLGRLLGPGTANDGGSPGTAIGAQVLDGAMLTQSGSTLASSTGSVAVVPRYGLSVFHPAGHWLEIKATYSWASTVSGDVLQIQLYEGVSGTQIAAHEHVQVGSASVFTTVSFVVPPNYGGTQRTFGLRVQRISGSGVCRVDDNSTRRGSLLAYDLGDQSIIRTV